MNATVTRSAAKSTSAKSVSTTAAGNTAPAKGKAAAKPASKSTVKTGAGKVAKTVANAVKPATKTSSTSTKAIAKPGETTVKSSVTPAAQTNAKGATTTKTVPAVTRAEGAKTTAQHAAKGATESEQAAQKKAPSLSSKETSGATMSSSNAGAGLRDKMEKPVVSKVSEVATKTTKPTAAPAEGRLLTEEEILKMSDKDYMNEAQLAFFKARLQQLERDLLKNAGETTEHLRETVLVPDPADRATIEEEHALELRTRDRERKLLKKVQQSIASIDAGEYGWCEETGEPIGIPRLLARPTATLSLEAQQRRELKQKLYGD
jgi:DnaK suppressor protein